MTDENDFHVIIDIEWRKYFCHRILKQNMLWFIYEMPLSLTSNKMQIYSALASESKIELYEILKE